MKTACMATIFLLLTICLAAQTESGYLITWGSQVGGPFPDNIIKISSSYYHSLALLADGSLAVWGDAEARNYYYDTRQYDRCNIPPGNDFIDVAAGPYGSLAVKSNGAIVCMGPDMITPPGNDYKAVAASGEMAYVALRTDGSIYCWYKGYDWSDLSYLLTDNVYTAIAAGDEHFVALKADGSLKAWGPESDSVNYVSSIYVVPQGNDFIAIDAGYMHSIALRSDGSIVAWGSNDYGECDVPAGNDFVAIAAGGIHNVALKADGSLVAWGYNEHGECNVPTGNNFISVYAGGRLYYDSSQFEHYECNSFAIKSNGEVVTWGSNTFGQLNIPQGNDFIKVKTGYYFNLALRADSTLVSWGSNNEEYNAPAGHNYIDFGVGDSYGIALKADGSLIAWWSSGFIGFNVPTDNDFIALSVQGVDNLALKSDGSVICWGLDIIGFVTYQPTGSLYTAIQASNQYYSGFAGYALTADGAVYKLQNGNSILIGTGFKAISENYALRTDGSIYSFCGNDYSDIPRERDFIKVVGSEVFGLAIKSDGSALGWGANNYHICDVPTSNDYLDITASCVAIVGSKDYHYITPKEISLIKAYPNPAMSRGYVTFETEPIKYTKSELSIYNIKGQKVRTFKTYEGPMHMIWDCKDEKNRPVPAGVYVYKLSMNTFVHWVKGSTNKSGNDKSRSTHYSETGKLIVLK